MKRLDGNPSRIAANPLSPRHGSVAEWFKALVLKTSVGGTPPWVRIPPLPPLIPHNLKNKMAYRSWPVWISTIEASMASKSTSMRADALAQSFLKREQDHHGTRHVCGQRSQYRHGLCQFCSDAAGSKSFRPLADVDLMNEHNKQAASQGIVGASKPRG